MSPEPARSRSGTHPRRFRRSLALTSAAVLAVGLSLSPPLMAGAQPSPPPTPTPSTNAPQPADPGARTSLRTGAGLKLQPVSRAAAAARLRSSDPGVTASLWEWNWPSVARECRNVLGPAGYGGVQVAPPQNSVKRTSLGNGSDSVLHPWWEVYQVVSYDLTSRMGTEREFRDMVTTCRNSGVKVYVDAVINHTTGQGNTSYGGQNYTPYNYPAVPYRPNDFHYNVGACSSSDGGIQDFNNLNQVFKCNLVGLEDLRTETSYVRGKLAGYLNKLLGYGVSGFRVDAAKHIGQNDLDAIYSRLHNTRDGYRPFWALEVFQGGPGVLDPQAFTRSGKVLGLEGARQIQQSFKSYPDEHVGSLATLQVFGAGSGLTAGKDTMSFVTNHDTDRNPGEYLGYKDGARYLLANMWLLADGYGTPQVYSSFKWTDSADSPPDKNGTSGLIADASCTNNLWTCDHRAEGVVAMVRWHNYVGKAAKRNVYTDGFNVLAFSRGNRGWAAFNNGSAAKQIRVQTGMAPGRYRDAISGTNVVTVNGSGVATVTVGALSAVAFTRADRL